MLSPSRAMTPEEEEILRTVIGEMHARFLEVIQEGRGLRKEDLGEAADGRILTAKQALEKHLIDEIGDFDSALTTAKSLSGLKTARVVRYRLPRGLLSLFAGFESRLVSPFDIQGILPDTQARFMYLWVPGAQGR